MARERTGYVYVLCFDRAFGHARHYVGCTCDPRGRLITHAQGAGARIVKRAAEDGIGFRLGALGSCTIAAMRRLERQVKDWHGADEFCELCHPENSRRIPGTRPFPLFALPFPQTSAELADCRPAGQELRVRFTGPGESQELMNAVRDMMQMNKESLGFIPVGGTAGLGISMAAGRMIVAEVDGTLAGFCSFTESSDPPTVRIHQTVVDDRFRRCGIGRGMIETLKRVRPDSVLTCKVRDDLVANWFWLDCGFLQFEAQTHETSGAKLNCYAYMGGGS